jgi:hypothetical protein
MGMTERARSAFDEIIKAMGEKDSQLLKREPDVKKLVVDIVRIVERARDPESWPVVSYPDNYADTHPADSKQWIQLMTLAALQDEELASILCYMRGTGCVLEPHQQFGFCIRPVVGCNGWDSINTYNNEKKALQGHTDTLLGLLKQLGGKKI